MKLTFALLISLFGLTFYGCSQAIPEHVPRVMPEFTFYTLEENQPFTRMSLAPEGNVVFNFFDPGCGHCQQEAEAMGEHAEAFKDVNLYFISQQDPQLVREFMETYAGKLSAVAQPQVLIDSDYTFLTLFYPTQYPALYVYSQKRELLAYMDGEHPVEDVIKAVQTKP